MVGFRKDTVAVSEKLILLDNHPERRIPPILQMRTLEAQRHRIISKAKDAIGQDVNPALSDSKDGSTPLLPLRMWCSPHSQAPEQWSL